MICFNCGQHYSVNTIPEFSKVEFNAQVEGFCSCECEQEDSRRLVEGNGIIASALKNNPQAFSDLNRIKLDVSGVVGQQLGNLIKFGREAQRHLGDEDESKQDNQLQYAPKFILQSWGDMPDVPVDGAAKRIERQTNARALALDTAFHGCVSYKKLIRLIDINKIKFMQCSQNSSCMVQSRETLSNTEF